MSNEYNEFTDLLPEKEDDPKRKDIINQLRIIEDDNLDYFDEENDVFLPSSLLKDDHKNKKEKKEETSFSYDDDEWMDTFMSLNIKPKSKKNRDIFNLEKKKKKKKKNKDKNELVDYNKEFETELALYKNLLIDQNKFTDSLQSEYDAIKGVKSTARGVNKNMTDLIQNITSARSLSMQLVEKNVNAKKLIAELTMKQKKENGLGEDGAGLSDFSANLLKQMINERNALTGKVGISDITEYDGDDDLFETLSENLGEDDRPSEVEKYLKYENRNVTIFACVNSEDAEDYYYIAKDEDGEIIEDYPLPLMNSISINRSTNIATDVYGKKYPIIWV